MNAQQSPQRPAAYAEERLITAILDGTYAPGATLPGERELAGLLGVTRPTVREALQRLSRDGWLLIRQGKPTAVRDFWRDGGLNVLSGLIHHQQHLPPDFVAQLLAVRRDFAPSYARAAVAHQPASVAEYLAGGQGLPDTAAALAGFDWGLHRMLTIASGNPIYTLILNGFAGFYEQMALHYFGAPAARAASREFYAALHAAALAGDADRAEAVTREVIEASIVFWQGLELAQ